MPKFVLLLLTTIAACATHTSQLDAWNTLKQQFPREQFLSAAADAPNLTNAHKLALFQLGQQFSVRVIGTTDSNNRVQTTTTGDTQETQTDRSLQVKVRSQTDQLVQGAEVHSLQMDDGSHRALAVLEKAKGRRILLQRLHRIEAEFYNALSAADTLGPKRLESIGWVKQAITLADLWQQSYQQLLVLDGDTTPLSPSTAQLQSRAVNQLQQLPFVLGFEPDIPTTQQQRITNALAQAGIRNSDQQQGYTLTISYNVQAPFARDALLWQRAWIGFTLSYQQQPQGAINWELKAVAQSRAQLSARLDQELSDRITTTFVEALLALAVDLS